MTTLVIVVAVLCAGAVITFIGARLIERTHRAARHASSMSTAFVST